MKTNQHRLAVTFGVLAGGLLAAALLPMAVASADQFDFTPDIATFSPTQVEGYPPLINEVTGTEQWNVFDLTTDSVKYAQILDGTDTQTTIGSFTNDDYLTSSALIIAAAPGVSDFIMSGGSQIDLADFGLGFENEWIDIPSGSDAGASDLLITPFGDFELFGSAFTDMATAIDSI
jgi:hypothetical protein